MTDTDIILVGLGPTGAILANLLGALGWKIDVFEASKDIYQLPRAVHFDDEVMRIFQMIGLSQEIESATTKVRGMDMLNADAALLARYLAPDEVGALGWHEGYMFYQPQLEAILRQGLARYPNVKLHLGCEVQAISKCPDGAEVRTSVSGSDEDEMFRARFVIGCCGSRSIVRRAIGSGQRDFHADQRWLVVDVRLLSDVSLPDVTVQYCEPARPCTYVPTPGNLRRFELMVMPGEADEELLAPAKLAQLLERWLSPDDYSVERAALYTFHALIAERWRDDALLIAGDAAHQMPPFLGQGLCAGAKDAANLFWKIDYVLRGLADSRLLDTYQQERESHVEAIIKADLWLSGIIQTTDAAIASQRDTQMLASDPANNLLTPPRIPLGGDLCGEHPSARLPFIQPLLLQQIPHDEVLGNGFALLGDVDLSDRAQSILKYLSIRHGQRPDRPIGEWLAKTGMKAVLIRPDRYVQAVVGNAEELDVALQPLERLLAIN